MKKALLILTVIFISFQFVFYQPNKVSAIGLDTVVKAVGGKAIIRGLSEKMGYALSKKQLDNVVDFVERKTYDGDQNAIDFMTKANALTGTPSKTGFKKYVLDPMAWLTGADIITTAISAFMMGYEGQTPVGTFAMCAKSPMDGKIVPPYPYWTYVYKTDNPADMYVIYYSNASAYWSDNSGKTAFYLQSYGSVKQYSYYNGSYGSPTTSQPGFTTSMYTKGGSWNTEVICDPVPVAEDVVNVTNNNIYTAFDNDTYNTFTTYNVEMDIPDTPNYDDTTPWNEVDPQLEKEVLLDDPNAEPDVKPEGSDWWSWILKPLKAIGDFIAGLADFLLSIIVPSDGFIDGLFSGLFDDFKGKLPVIDQLSNLFTGISEVTTTENAAAPTFEITMPEQYGGGTFSIIDFSYFEDWRVWILNFIRFSAWFIFLKRLYNRIPKMIY